MHAIRHLIRTVAKIAEDKYGILVYVQLEI